MGTVYKPKNSPYFWIKYYRDGKAYYESSKSTIKKDAKDLLTIRGGQILKGKFPGLRALKTTVEDLLSLALKTAEIQKRKSMYEAKRYVHLLKKHFGAIRASNVTTENVTDYRRKRQCGWPDAKREKVSDHTINKELGFLRRSFRLGLKQDPPLVTRVPNFEMTPDDHIRKGFLDIEGFKALRGILPDHWKVMLCVGFFTGMRAGEILGLRWEQVDFSAGTISLNMGETKNGEGRTVPMIPELREVLERWWMESRAQWPACPWVIHCRGTRTMNYRKSWMKACETAGLTGLLFHDIRRSAVKNLIQAGIPQVVAMAISGHKTTSMFNRYAIVDKTDLELATVKLSAYLKEKESEKKPNGYKMVKLAESTE
jgi:integrase